MHSIVDFLKSLYNAERLLELARTLLGSPIGLAGLFGILFSETGLLVGFFLPGDSLLFSVGVASGAAGVNLWLLAALLMCAAIVGDNLGYFLGRHSGPRIFTRLSRVFFIPTTCCARSSFTKNTAPGPSSTRGSSPSSAPARRLFPGLPRCRMRGFCFSALLGGVFWIAFMMTIGFELGQVARDPAQL